MEIIEDIQPVAIKTCKYFGINAVSELWRLGQCIPDISWYKRELGSTTTTTTTSKIMRQAVSTQQLREESCKAYGDKTNSVLQASHANAIR